MPTHAEQRILPYTPEQLFALVADIERYPEFLPWCVGARIRERRPDLIVADLIIGFRMFRERYTSRVVLQPPQRIDVMYVEGPFRYLNNHWIFEPVSRSADRPVGGTMLTFHIEFEFRSTLLQSLVGGLFNEAVRRMVAAFEGRAKRLYGGQRVRPGLRELAGS